MGRTSQEEKRLRAVRDFGEAIAVMLICWSGNNCGVSCRSIVDVMLKVREEQTPRIGSTSAAFASRVSCSFLPTTHTSATIRIRDISVTRHGQAFEKSMLVSRQVCSPIPSPQ
jgi:hypothetical protein